ncbi:hypothetical protein ANN_13326 [Periplaneta americana]|uniref:Uncharacterized protein n=1 Tax=Periplaneta americana TaxID=6978 RepID=A0ABQ8TL64_PERAM|nr:hypothetical protein ANN_13326 [Periplaneta americana]
MKKLVFATPINNVQTLQGRVFKACQHIKEQAGREKELVGSLAEKKLSTESCTGRNGEREKSLGQKKISDIDDIEIYGSYAETKRKAEIGKIGEFWVCSERLALGQNTMYIVFQMAPFTPQEKVQCCYWLAEFKFPVTVQRRFREKKNGRVAPDSHTIVHWHKHLLENGDFHRYGGDGERRMKTLKPFVKHSHEVHGNLSGKQLKLYTIISRNDGLVVVVLLHGPYGLLILHHLDFFLWGFVKDRVYNTRVDNLQVLRQRIIDTVRSVTPQMLHNARREIEYRLDVCRATRVGHVEIY